MNARLRQTTAKPAHHGIVTVEFAIGSVLFFALVFGLIELARACYLWNTVAHVTRTAARGAAMVDITDPDALEGVSRAAMFGQGWVPLAQELTAQHIRYRFLRDDGVEIAGICPIENARNCAANPRGADCIRMVEARLCDPEGDGCAPVPYSTLVPISAFPPGTFNFPSFATIAPVGSLGRNPNTPSVCR